MGATMKVTKMPSIRQLVKKKKMKHCNYKGEREIIASLVPQYKYSTVCKAWCAEVDTSAV